METRKAYEPPVAEIIELEQADVVTGSELPQV